MLVRLITNGHLPQCPTRGRFTDLFTGFAREKKLKSSRKCYAARTSLREVTICGSNGEPMNLPEIAKQKSQELLAEYKDQLWCLNPIAIAQLAFMRGFVYGSVENKNIDTSLLAKVDSLARRG